MGKCYWVYKQCKMEFEKIKLLRQIKMQSNTMYARNKYQEQRRETKKPSE